MTECFTNVKCFDLTVSSIEIDSDLVIRFHGAAREGYVSTVKELLEEGVPVDFVDEFDWTALFYAAWSNRTDVIQLLLQNGTNVNKRGRSGDTPLHWAAMWNSTEAITVLMEHGAFNFIKNDRGQTPIHVARRQNKQAAVRTLEKSRK